MFTYKIWCINVQYYIVWYHNVDGIIDEKTIVEIKAPYSAKNSQNAIEAVESGKVCQIPI